jgi:hypothetical protein
LGSQGKEVTMIHGSFALAAMTPSPGQWNSTVLPEAVPPAVAVRAIDIASDTTFPDLLRRTWYGR